MRAFNEDRPFPILREYSNVWVMDKDVEAEVPEG